MTRDSVNTHPATVLSRASLAALILLLVWMAVTVTGHVAVWPFDRSTTAPHRGDVPVKVSVTNGPADDGSGSLYTWTFRGRLHREVVAYGEAGNLLPAPKGAQDAGEIVLDECGPPTPQFKDAKWTDDVATSTGPCPVKATVWATRDGSRIDTLPGGDVLQSGVSEWPDWSLWAVLGFILLAHLAALAAGPEYDRPTETAA